MEKDHQVTVRAIIDEDENLARVILDYPTYMAISGTSPLIKPVNNHPSTEGRKIRSFDINGVKFFSVYNPAATEPKDRVKFVMDTKLAYELLEERVEMGKAVHFPEFII